MKIVASKRQFWILAIWDFFSPSTFNNLSSMWAGPYLRDIIKLDESTASYSLLMLPLAWVIGSPFLVAVSDLVKTRKWVVVSSCGVGLGTCIAFMFVTSETNHALVLAMLFVFALGSSAVLAVGNAMFKEMNPGAVATSMGCGNFHPFIATAILQTISPFLLSVAETETLKSGHSLHSYKYGLWMPSAIMLSIAFIASLLTSETFPKPSLMSQELMSNPNIYTSTG